ncbi:MAG: ribonuclease E inhibitor RraB [Bacteroidia bacterium]|nr:ribonuclease E inhibitor RraB [Bacteroidia bacterium]
MTVSEDIKSLVENQKFLNRRVLQNLEPLGVSENDERKLDFFFIAPDQKSASKLADFFKKGSDYRIYPPHHNGSTWSVTGATSPLSLSPHILDKWVEKMCILGQKFACKFDGWGTLVL